MNLIERKANIEKTVAQIKIEIDAVAARRESLVAHMNALLGQIHLIDQILAEEVPLPPEDLAPPLEPDDLPEEELPPEE